MINIDYDMSYCNAVKHIGVIVFNRDWPDDYGNTYVPYANKAWNFVGPWIHSRIYFLEN